MPVDLCGASPVSIKFHQCLVYQLAQNVLTGLSGIHISLCLAYLPLAPLSLASITRPPLVYLEAHFSLWSSSRPGKAPADCGDQNWNL